MVKATRFARRPIPSSERRGEGGRIAPRDRRWTNSVDLNLLMLLTCETLASESPHFHVSDQQIDAHIVLTARNRLHDLILEGDAAPDTPEIAMCEKTVVEAAPASQAVAARVECETRHDDQIDLLRVDACSSLSKAMSGRFGISPGLAYISASG